MKKLYILFILFIISISIKLPYSQDTVKIMSYNLLNYDVTDTTRNPYYRTIFQNVSPDILVVEEINSQNAVNVIRDRVLNVLGIGTYAAGTFINGFDSDNGIFFRTSKFLFISNTPIHTELRDINEFKVVYIPTTDTIRLYAVHLKASNTTADQQQRAREVDSLRKVTNALPPGSNFMVMGDFNIYGSTEPAYQKLLQVTAGTEGHFIDMYNLSGTWNNSSYAIYHTQSTRVRSFGGGATGGMDDRFDMILYSKAVNETGGMKVVPQSLTAYGNDGNHYNDSINKMPNNAVPQNVANALHYASDHTPVFAKFVMNPPISVKNISETAEMFELEQNYPNPFNPITTINYELRNTNDVRLSIFDVLGREIAVLVNKKQNSGEYEVIWDGANYPSGIYYYRLIADGNIITKKMILSK
jgi:hypothetical protein